MPIRPHLLAAGLAGLSLASAPACARDGQAGEVADKLSDPQAQVAASAALAAMAQTILDLDVSSYARALSAMGGDESLRHLPPDATLGDLAGPGAERMPRTIARNVPRAMGSAAEMARAIDEMMPQLKETARKLKRSLPRY